MGMKYRVARWVGLAGLAAVVAVAQTTSTQTTSGGKSPAAAIAFRSGRTGVLSTFAPGTILAGGVSLQNVKGHPFAAEEDVDTIQTLADGTRITQATQKTLIYRDSEGRTRTEHIFTPPPGVTMVSVPSFVTIMDPASGYRYTIDQNNHTARRMAWHVAARRLNQTAVASSAARVIPGSPATSPATATSATPASSRPHPEISEEPLGTETIEGMAAEGKRTTVVYPEGFMGNDRPITTVTETWTSSELGMVVLSKVSDPRNGETTSKLNNISFEEPDAALFEVPAGYSIVDQEPMRVGTATK